METASDYLDGIVAAVSRVGTLIVTMGVISGLILIIFYVDNFSMNKALYEVATSARDELQREHVLYSYQIKAIDVHLATVKPNDVGLANNLRPHCTDQNDLQQCRQKLLDQLSLKDLTRTDLVGRIGLDCSPPNALEACRETLIQQRSVVSFRMMRIDNEMKLVNLGHVKLPFLGHEIATNDASVVLGFFLAIFASVTVITVHHLRRALTDNEVAEKIRESATLLRARLVLIYAPIDAGFASGLTLLTFFMPSIVMAVVAGEQGWLLVWRRARLEHLHIFERVLIQCGLLLAIAAFLLYVAIILVLGWRAIGIAVNQKSSSPSLSASMD